MYRNDRNRKYISIFHANNSAGKELSKGSFIKMKYVQFTGTTRYAMA